MTLSPHRLAEVIGETIHVVDVDGTFYATDTYWMAPIEGTGVAELLRWWNLEPTPGRYIMDWEDDCAECGDIARRPLRRAGEPYPAEKLAKLIGNLTGNRIDRFRMEDGRTAYVLDPAYPKRPYAVFVGVDDKGDPFHAYANPDYLQTAFGGNWHTDDIELRCAGPESPMWAKSTTGHIACVMPVRLS